MDQQQAQSQAQEQEGAPAPATATTSQNQNQPRTLEERQEAWREANQRWLNATSNVTVNMQITEEQIAHYENQLYGLEDMLWNHRGGLAYIYNRRTSYEEEMRRTEPSEDLVRKFELEGEAVENHSRLVLGGRVQAVQVLMDGEQAWAEEHRTQIEEYQRWQQWRMAAEESNRYHEERGLRYHQWRETLLNGQIHRLQREVSFHQRSSWALQTQQPVPFPPLERRTHPGPQPTLVGPPAVHLPPQPFQPPQQPFKTAAQHLQTRLPSNQPPHGQIQGLPHQGPQRRGQGGQAQTRPHQYPYRSTGGAAPFWTEAEENWLVVHTMYSQTANWLSRNIPGGNGRSVSSIHGHLADMRSRCRLPMNWTIRASSSTDYPWTIDEDIEIMRWHANGRTSIDVRIFFEYNRSGTAVYVRANYLLEDPALARGVIDIENRQREALLEMDTNGDSRMPGVDETAEEEQGTEELRQAISDSLAERPT